MKDGIWAKNENLAYRKMEGEGNRTGYSLQCEKLDEEIVVDPWH